MQMRNKRNLTFIIFLFLAAVDLLETSAQYCFKKTAQPESELQIRAWADILTFIHSVSFSPFLWLGLLSMLAVFVLWSTVLSKIDLSVAVAVCSFSYITIPIVSMLFLHEHISFVRWIGIALIIAGVTCVSLTSTHKEEAAQ